ncbi:MAG: hypothetical protein Q9223_007602 [Gallowayella weberi]
MFIKASLLALWLAAMATSAAVPMPAPDAIASPVFKREELDGDVSNLYKYTKEKRDEVDGDLDFAYAYKQKREELDGDVDFVYAYKQKREELDGDF